MSEAPNLSEALEERYGRNLASVRYVSNGTVLGTRTGFFLGPDLILTTRFESQGHAISCEITDHRGNEFASGRVTADDLMLGVRLLRISGTESIPANVLMAHNWPGDGDTVVALDRTGTWEFPIAVTSASIRKLPHHGNVIALGQLADHKDGAPVFSADGKLLGVIQTLSTGAEIESVLLPSGALLPLLQGGLIALVSRARHADEWDKWRATEWDDAANMTKQEAAAFKAIRDQEVENLNLKAKLETQRRKIRRLRARTVRPAFDAKDHPVQSRGDAQQFSSTSSNLQGSTAPNPESLNRFEGSDRKIPRAVVIWIATAIIVALGLFPPLCRGTGCFAVGRGWIGALPGPAIRIDFSGLGEEWGLVIALAVAVLWTLPELSALFSGMRTSIEKSIGWLIFAGVLIYFAVNRTPPKPPLLPADAKLIEAVDLRTVVGKPRELVLWMQNPKAVVRQGGCPDEVYGDFWLGPTRLSLVDSATNALLNTITIFPPVQSPADENNPLHLRISPAPHVRVAGGEDSFQIPFAVSGSYYHVPSPNAKKEGKPAVLTLRDFTGEGVATEFAIFSYEACGIVSTSVLGYSKQSDRVVQYPVVVEQDGRSQMGPG